MPRPPRSSTPSLTCGSALPTSTRYSVPGRRLRGFGGTVYTAPRLSEAAPQAQFWTQKRFFFYTVHGAFSFDASKRKRGVHLPRRGPQLSPPSVDGVSIAPPHRQSARVTGASLPSPDHSFGGSVPVDLLPAVPAVFPWVSPQPGAAAGTAKQAKIRRKSGEHHQKADPLHSIPIPDRPCHEQDQSQPQQQDDHILFPLQAHLIFNSLAMSFKLIVKILLTPCSCMAASPQSPLRFASPCGESSARSLAPPFPAGTAAAGFRREPWKRRHHTI